MKQLPRSIFNHSKPHHFFFFVLVFAIDHRNVSFLNWVSIVRLGYSTVLTMVLLSHPLELAEIVWAHLVHS